MSDRNAYMRDWWARNPGKRATTNRARRIDRVANPIKFLIYKAKERAKKRGFEFSLTIADFPAPPKTCPVLGIEIVYGNSKQMANSPTLDRIDNSKGYVPGNVIIVSWRANNLKSNATLDELRAVVAFYSALGGT